MCRSIKQLRFAGAEPTEQELHDAALQFVRKVSGYRKPSQRNQEAFELAVQEIAASTRKMLDNLVSAPPPARAADAPSSVKNSNQTHSHPHVHADRKTHSLPNHSHPRRKAESTNQKS
jgi:hypothetical protein